MRNSGAAFSWHWIHLGFDADCDGCRGRNFLDGAAAGIAVVGARCGMIWAVPWATWLIASFSGTGAAARARRRFLVGRLAVFNVADPSR